VWRPLQGQRDERTAQVAAAALADAATAKVRHMHLRTSRVWSSCCCDRISLVETLLQQKGCFNRKAAPTERLLQQKGWGRFHRHK